ncbi:uncharacterized protein BX664DRAFT_260002 [Halteromyces radiatus]|uniref:uncharacterized protein n=1 Tax=Halteromyces radiatus TaxID=101107 RepID=UPI00221F449F|nr:uncharacterized protein BX664DRAFT_260002 [Halteromyces radiatus]KAI8092541.1 hypothetical protein BX664DRAFT_260002 [Halteromyces radiatus]
MGALELFEALSSHDTGLLSIQSGDESNQSNDVSYAFSRVIEAVQDIPRTDLAFRLEILKTIKRIFTMYPSTRDVFRLSGGYVGLVSMIVALENAFTDGSDFIKLSDQPHQPLDHHKLKQTLSQVLEMILFVLMESMRDNDVNRQYFSKEVGYDTLQNALRLTGALTSDGLAAPLFGMLFSVMVQDETMCGLFTGQHANVLVDAGTLDHSTLLQHIDYTLNDALVDIHNPDVALTILQLQQSVTWDQELANAVLVALYSLIRGNRQNQIKLNRSGLVLLALQRVYPRGPTEKHPLSLCQIKNVETEKTTNLLLQIIKKLMAMGIGDKELRYLFQCFGTDGYLTDLEDPAIDGLVDLILHGMNRSRWPNFIQFDVSGSTSSRRTASLEFSALPNFPPSAPGYTIMLWIHIERWNNDANMTIWTLWDDQQHLFFHVYLDASTRNLHIHSGTNKVDCRFESFEFKPGFWYHIGLVHHKSRLGASLNGDALNLYFHLGARYKSLYQDSLRQFQTYEASTALFLNLRGITKRREMNKSVLANVMRGGTTTMLPENKILLALIAGNTLAYGAQTGLTLTGLSEECLDRIETDADIRYMLLNSAIPKIEQAIYATNSMGTLHGNPGIAYPFGLDESVWKVGGCALGLNLVQRSESSLMLIKSIELLIEMIRYSWRNSDDMERCHGYEILASILKQKRDLITVDLFELLLHFVGKNSSLPEESVISNPYAYRSVILNFEIWKKTSIPVQKAHLDQFILFMETSNKHTFNLKRLLKVHLVKKMLLAFRMNIYAKELIPNVVKALKAVVLSSWTTESIRAIATFLASTAPNGM